MIETIVEAKKEEVDVMNNPSVTTISQQPSPHEALLQRLEPLDQQLHLSDNLMIMLVKEIQYVETLTGFKFGFIQAGKKPDNFAESINEDVVPKEYWPLWSHIAHGESARCRNLRIFLNKMAVSKSRAILKSFFLVYMMAIQQVIYIDSKFKPTQYTERQLIEFSKLFSRNFLKKVIVQNEYHEFLEIDQRFAPIALLNRDISVYEVKSFQDRFLSMYTRWRSEFAHLIEVIYFCIEVEYFSLPVSYLYEGYFKNTELETQRNIPKYIQKQ